MSTSAQARITEIRKRVEAYRKHENDQYAYYQGEIDAVRELKDHAPEDIEFLLSQLSKKSR